MTVVYNSNNKSFFARIKNIDYEIFNMGGKNTYKIKDSIIFLSNKESDKLNKFKQQIQKVQWK